jgi:hypothetical protein
MDITYNSSCYHFEKIEYAKGLFDETVSATYIIHLEGNGRLAHIKDQLEKYQPTKTVYIVHNKGFKKCQKKLIEQISYQDLSDAFLQAFKHATTHNYGNILILEDDFIFSPEIQTPKTIHNINSFLIEKSEEEFIYYLGCNPIFIVPYNYYTYYSLHSLSMHGIIYSKQTIRKKLDVQYKHWDVIISKNISNKYLYYKPLCYQTYPDTENKLSWSEKDNFLISYIKHGIIHGLNLNNMPEPGFTILYYFAKCIFLLFIIIILVVGYTQIGYITKFSRFIKKNIR